jgi:hypothetical protein
MKPVLYLLLAGCFSMSELQAQLPQQNDLEALTRKIPVMPSTVEALHKAFTKETQYGEKFRDAELLTPVWQETKELIAAIHDPAIRRKMKASPRSDMPDSIHYEEERLKLALRPMLGESSLAGISTTDPVLKQQLKQVLELQKVFDWQIYYREHYNLEKLYREKAADLTIENSLEKTQKKLELQQKLFGLQQALWLGRLENYRNGIARLVQLKKETGNVAAPVFADVQARALEAIEKLIWNEMQMVMTAELIYQDLKILAFYQ